MSAHCHLSVNNEITRTWPWWHQIDKMRNLNKSPSSLLKKNIHVIKRHERWTERTESRSHCCREFTLRMETSKWTETFPKGFLVLASHIISEMLLSARETAQQLGGVQLFRELCWAPSIRVGWLITACKTSSRESSVFFRPPRAFIRTCLYPHTNTLTYP